MRRLAKQLVLRGIMTASLYASPSNAHEAAIPSTESIRRVASIETSRPVEVGGRVSPTVVLRLFPEHDCYGYAIINGRTVVVDSITRIIVKVD
jgi:hypothetical protein